MKNNLKELRTKQNLTQQELAEIMEVSRQMISYIENGDKKPNLILALKLADFFKISVKKIFELEADD